MRSHVNQFTIADIWRGTWPAGAVVLALSLVLHATLAMGWWPKRWPATDVDRTILTHQIASAERAHDAAVVLVGDSSCLMDIDAALLGRLTGQRVLNLGTLSYLGLDAHGTLLRRYLAHNPPPTDVILALHPEALRQISPSPVHEQFFARQVGGTSGAPAAFSLEYVRHATGMAALRDRLITRTASVPLTGAFGRTYKFASEVERYLEAHSGSLLEAQTNLLSGGGILRLSDTVRRAMPSFVGAIPDGTRLHLLVTPMIASDLSPALEPQWREMVGGWELSAGNGAKRLMLPSTLPRTAFATRTHLNARGVEQLTWELAAHWKDLPPVTRSIAR